MQPTCKAYLSMLKLRMEPAYSSEAFVIITGGINDCTFKDTFTGKYMYNFATSEDMVKHVMDQFEDIDRRIRDIHSTAKIAYSDIIGMDMFAYKWCLDPTPKQQYAFNVAIMEINRNIVKLNVGHNILTPWLAKNVHIPRKHGVSHVCDVFLQNQSHVANTTTEIIA